MTASPDALREALDDEPTAEEVEAMRAEAESFRLPPPPPIPVRGRFYLTKCRSCGWVGSSEQCGSDNFSDDSDVYCPVCCDSGCKQKPTEAEAAEYGEAIYQRLATLSGEVETLRAVLRPFADEAGRYDPPEGGDDRALLYDCVRSPLRLRHLRVARAALAPADNREGRTG